jgi:uncharacterized membrane protein YjjP (DUF1212 family)
VGDRHRYRRVRVACLVVTGLTGVTLLAATTVGGTAQAAPSPTATPSSTASPTTGVTSTASPTTSASATPSASTTTGSTTPSGSPTPSTSPTPTQSASTTSAQPTPTASVSTTTTRVVRTATPAAVQSSGIPLATVLFAVLVLIAALAVLWAVYRQGVRRGALPPAPAAEAVATADRDEQPGWSSHIPDVPSAGQLGFLVALGEAMIDSGDPVTHVSTSLRRVARVNGVDHAEIIVLPTALIVSVPDEDAVQTAVAAAGTVRLRLDQIDAVFEVVTAAERGEVGPQDGTARLQQARRLRPPFTPAQQVVGYIVLTLGLALILRADWWDLLVAGVLGALVGLLQLAAQRVTPAYQVFLPVVSAFGVSVAVFLLARTGPELTVLAALVAPLVTFLPGALLTTSVIELSTGQMISGAGRLAAGAMQLVLLAIGIVAGAQLVGVPASSLPTDVLQPLGGLAPWVGVAVFGTGVVVHHCARPASLRWIILVLYVAYAGQVIGGLFFGGVLSAFVGAALMTPVAMFAATQRSGPPTLVSFLPAFWLLVPGALGLVGVTNFLGDNRVSGASSLVSAGATMIGIALGVLLGLAAGTGIAAGAARVRERRGQPHQVG